MKVVFLEDVSGVAFGGEIKEVKNGFARNYLIPQNLAVPANKDTLQRVRHLGKQAEDQRVRTLNDMKALGEMLEGTSVNVAMRTGASGRLYGSVTNAIIAEELSKTTGREIDRRIIELPESVREVGVFAARLRLHSEVTVKISVLVYPTDSDPDEVRASIEMDQSDEGLDTAVDHEDQIDGSVANHIDQESDSPEADNLGSP